MEEDDGAPLCYDIEREDAGIGFYSDQPMMDYQRDDSFEALWMRVWCVLLRTVRVLLDLDEVEYFVEGEIGLVCIWQRSIEGRSDPLRDYNWGVA